MSTNDLRQKLDKLFDTYFIKDSKSRVSLVVLSDKLGIPEDECIKYLERRGFQMVDKDDMLYLPGYKYNDNLRTPQLKSIDNFLEIHKTENKGQVRKPERDYPTSSSQNTTNLHNLHNQGARVEMNEKEILTIQLEEYKRKERESQQIIKRQQEEIRKQIRKQLEMEDKHEDELREHFEKTNLGHALNIDIAKTLERISKNLSELSGKDIKILLLVDSLEKDGNRHSRKIFIPKEQNYSFTISNEFKHENPDLKTHYR